MPNADYNKQVAQGYSKKGGKQGYSFRKGAGKSEDGPAHKDTVKAWPKPGPNWGTSLNRAANFPVIKTHVVKDGVD